jgi:hypothetical protein
MLQSFTTKKLSEKVKGASFYYYFHLEELFLLLFSYEIFCRNESRLANNGDKDIVLVSFPIIFFHMYDLCSCLLFESLNPVFI